MAFHLIPRLDRDPKFVQQAQTAGGKVAILFLFVLPLWLLNSYWRQMEVLLLVLTFLPQYRRQILVVAAPALAILAPFWIPMDSLSLLAAREGLPASFNLLLLARIATGAVVIGLAVAANVILRHPKAGPLKRPLVAWHVLFCLLVVGTSLLPLPGAVRMAAWAFVFALSGYFWYFCYTLIDRTAKGHDALPVQEGTWQPVWTVGASTGTPFVKGAAYLREIEAKNPEELAVTQLKGVKLIWWATFLRIAFQGMMWGLHGSLLPTPIPTFDAAFSAGAAGHPYPVLWCWASLIAAFFENIINLSIWGHQIVACCRMAGFRALRNTFRPLQARTIAEFWNRYYFYFKELMVNVFFYPAFLRYFRGQPRLRKFAATMAAACFGNMIFHFFRDIHYCAELGLWKAIAGFHVYALYCLVLGGAIGLSQIRSRKPPDPSASWFRSRLWPGICVGGFYCLLHIFDDTGRTYSITQHLGFLFHLFAIGG
jgi:hypothetical protein